MAAARGAHTVKTSGSSEFDIDTASITTQASGSTFYLWLSYFDTAILLSVTDSKGNTWSPAMGTSTGGVIGDLYYVENGTGGSGHFVSLEFDSGSTEPFGTFIFGEVTGVTSDGLDVFNVVDDPTPSTFEVTLTGRTQDDELAIAFIASNSASNPATLAESTGFSIFASELNGASFFTGGAADKSYVASGNITPSWTSSGAGACVVGCATFKSGAPAAGQPAGRRLGGLKFQPRTARRGYYQRRSGLFMGTQDKGFVYSDQRRIIVPERLKEAA